MSAPLRKTKYNILHKGKILHKNLSEEEYFDIMEDYAIEYYQSASPKSDELQTEMIEE